MELEIQNSLPSAAIAHVRIFAPSVSATTRFYVTLGLKKIAETDKMAIVELRGGTHLQIFAFQNELKNLETSFDLMVDDLHGFHSKLKRAGLLIGDIERDKSTPHHVFSVVDPDGRKIQIYSSHVQG